MSNEIEKLHSAIRRYCIEQHSYWTKKYQGLASSGNNRSGYEYTPEALSTFPRYNVLQAILNEIERHRPSEFASLDEARHAFMEAASNAHSNFTQPPIGTLDQRAMNEEREALNHFIAKLTSADLLRVEPLFYRLRENLSQELAR